ncbi:hypothetical protein PIROE2DRAFT_16736 [Piromyces sp. E2]|nr:hypothetical protein PIROE2DRAFT_16736 [Piromyces sp. E2]|eukprot:OUM58089.1 hypothetical protein PIROE2DRAFT_16736 [Piromyces sp. E2]
MCPIIIYSVNPFKYRYIISVNNIAPVVIHYVPSKKHSNSKIIIILDLMKWLKENSPDSLIIFIHDKKGKWSSQVCKNNNETIFSHNDFSIFVNEFKYNDNLGTYDVIVSTTNLDDTAFHCPKYIRDPESKYVRPLHHNSCHIIIKLKIKLKLK